eukprot:3073791-Pyramimonas_sp.AAC.1
MLWPSSGPWHAGRPSLSDSKAHGPGRPACANQAGPAVPVRARRRALVGESPSASGPKRKMVVHLSSVGCLAKLRRG